jgi:hypothetical protein
MGVDQRARGRRRKVRREWTAEDERELRRHSKNRTPVTAISRALKCQDLLRVPLLDCVDDCSAATCLLWIISGLSSQRHLMSALPLKADISVTARAGRIYEYTPLMTLHS